MTRVTLDNNVFISALQFGGKPLHLLQPAGQGTIEIAISEAIVTEVMRVLRDKFRWPADKLQMAERSIRELCVVVAPEQNVNAVPDDPDDNRIIECADAAGSEFIITGDKHLLRLRRYGRIAIIKPDDFVGQV